MSALDDFNAMFPPAPPPPVGGVLDEFNAMFPPGGSASSGFGGDVDGFPPAPDDDEEEERKKARLNIEPEPAPDTILHKLFGEATAEGLIGAGEGLKASLPFSTVLSPIEKGQAQGGGGGTAGGDLAAGVSNFTSGLTRGGGAAAAGFVASGGNPFGAGAGIAANEVAEIAREEKLKAFAQGRDISAIDALKNVPGSGRSGGLDRTEGEDVALAVGRVLSAGLLGSAASAVGGMAAAKEGIRGTLKELGINATADVLDGVTQASIQLAQQGIDPGSPEFASELAKTAVLTMAVAGTAGGLGAVKTRRDIRNTDTSSPEPDPVFTQEKVVEERAAVQPPTSPGPSLNREVTDVPSSAVTEAVPPPPVAPPEPEIGVPPTDVQGPSAGRGAVDELPIEPVQARPEGEPAVEGGGPPRVEPEPDTAGRADAGDSEDFTSPGFVPEDAKQVRREAESIARNVDLNERRDLFDQERFETPESRGFRQVMEEVRAEDRAGATEGDTDGFNRRGQVAFADAEKIIADPRGEVASDKTVARIGLRSMEVKQQYQSLRKRMNSERLSDADRVELEGDLFRLEQEQDTLLTALNRTGSEAARALNIRKLRLDDDLTDIVTVRNRSKHVKGGGGGPKDLTPKQDAALVKEVEALRKRNDELEKAVEKETGTEADAAIKREKKARRKSVKRSREDIIASLKEKLEGGCVI